jgi:hypothetical protein
MPLPPIEAPDSKRDPRFLGEGASKMVWLIRPDAELNALQIPRMNKVMVNAFDWQLMNGRKGTEDEILKERMAEQRNEYEFTRMVRDEFPDLIPGVYLITGRQTFLPEPRFRYAKDRCDPLPKNADLFHHMIRISDEVIKQGWVYLDMKPGNIGQFQGRVLLIDTDPSSFYRIPFIADTIERRRIRHFYRVSCHMTILLFCFNYVKEISPVVLQEFIRSKGYDEALFRQIYNEPPIQENIIASYNNRIAAEGGYPVHVEADEIMKPSIYIRHYGDYKGIHALTRLQQIIDYKP